MDYEKWHSPALGQDMELKVYGHAGKPVLVFPSGGGRFYEYEDFGMVEACRAFLNEGKIQLFAVDSVDNQAWHNHSLHPCDRAKRHEQYERYLLDEVVPFIRERNPSGMRLMATGCSGGAYHAANILFRHPDVFDAVIALSGLYSHRFVCGDRWDDCLYFHFPLNYLPSMPESHQLDMIRRSQIVLCVGQGAWETTAEYDCIGDTRAMSEALRAKGIACWADIWGFDVDHDWVWWRKQMPYFLGHLV